MAIIKVLRILVDMLLDIYPNFYGLYVTTEGKGIKKMIIQWINTTYGTMVAIIL